MKLIKEIVSKQGKVHFRRWEIFSCRWFSIYIHGIYERDLEEHLHDHPWNYCSVVIKGKFVEQSMKDGRKIFKTLKPGSISYQEATRFHKIYELITPSVYTLFFTSSRKREWGYSTEKGWIDNVRYRKLKHLKIDA